MEVSRFTKNIQELATAKEHSMIGMVINAEIAMK
jgi:hypothetical protein